jgi:acyl dehydratase
VVELDAKGFHQYRYRSVARRFEHDALAPCPSAASARNQCAGVFAVGDVRGGSIKRVASGVGERSMTISFVHRVLQRIGNRSRPTEIGGMIMQHDQPLFLDDLYVGQRFTSGTYRIDEEQIKAFAAEFDPQPFHLDEAAAQGSVFRGLAASGWHTAAVTMRLLVAGGLPLANGIIGLGGELTWPKPTRPGDILRVESEVIEILPSQSRPSQAVVTVKSTTQNQAGEPVLVFAAKVLVVKRPSA